MRVLLDTHAFIWATAAPHRLGGQRSLVEDEANELVVSAATSWEIAIKFALGRLSLPSAPDRYVPERVRMLSATPLPIEHAHALAVATLPPHHGDPFDRLLIVQARVLRIPVITADRAFDDYDVEVLSIA